MPKEILSLVSMIPTASLSTEHPADEHERCAMHVVETLDMRRRLSLEDDPILGNVVYWSHHICTMCDWHQPGSVWMRNESSQLKFDLVQTGGDQ